MNINNIIENFLKNDYKIALAVLLILGVLYGIPLILSYVKRFLDRSKCRMSLDLQKNLFMEGEKIIGTLYLTPTVKRIESNGISVILKGTRTVSNSTKSTNLPRSREVEIYCTEQELEQDRTFLPGESVSYDFSFSFPVVKTDPIINDSSLIKAALIFTKLTSPVNYYRPPRWELRAVLKYDDSAITICKFIKLTSRSGKKLLFR